MNLSLLNSLCYTAGWFWCVFLGINGEIILAAMGAFFLIFLQLYRAKIKDEALYIQDLLLVIFSVPLGTLLEFFFIQSDLIHYLNTKNSLPPIWIICLYPLFALQLNHSLKLIKNNYSTSFLVGFLGAPLSYVGGNSLGALTFQYPLFPTWAMLGISWGVFLCILTKTANIVHKATEETLSARDSSSNLKFLYDGECPICKREVCFLQSKGNQSKVKFIDITSKEFLAVHNTIDYQTAMSQIHAIDSKGNLLVGIPAFAAVYARCQLLVTSTLLRIPFIESTLKPLYKLFAKYRLLITGRRG